MPFLPVLVDFELVPAFGTGAVLGSVHFYGAGGVGGLPWPTRIVFSTRAAMDEVTRDAATKAMRLVAKCMMMLAKLER